MSRNISNPDFINGNGFSSSSDSDFDEEFALQAYPTTTIYERSTIYAPPLASNAAPYETIADNIVLSATGTQFDVSMDFDINVGEQLVDTSGLWLLPLSGVMTSSHDADSSNFIVE